MFKFSDAMHYVCSTAVNMFQLFVPHLETGFCCLIIQRYLDVVVLVIMYAALQGFLFQVLVILGNCSF